jgi:hypothetical protein
MSMAEQLEDEAGDDNFDGITDELEADDHFREKFRTFQRFVTDPRDELSLKPMKTTFTDLKHNATRLIPFLIRMQRNSKKRQAPSIPKIMMIFVALFSKILVHGKRAQPEVEHRYFWDLKRLLNRVRTLWKLRFRRKIKALD